MGLMLAALALLLLMCCADLIPTHSGVDHVELFSHLLASTRPNVTLGGELEGDELWMSARSALDDAWKAYKPVHASLFAFDAEFRSTYLSPEFDGAVRRLRRGVDAERDLKGMFREIHPGIVRSDKLFTPRFVEHMINELRSFAATGIPVRRPNGMNRFGVILENVPGGVTSISASFDELVQSHLRPLAEMLFPESARKDDTQDHFAFTVLYKQGEDVELKEHRDASVLTMNLCLGPSFSGSQLYFVDPETGNRQYVEHSPGAVLFHRGGLRHSAMPLESGERTNLILWLFGEDGYVRDALYDEGDRLTWSERWSPQERQEL